MRDCEVENEMYRKAVELIEKRYPAGWGGAGVVHTSNYKMTDKIYRREDECSK